MADAWGIPTTSNYAGSGPAKAAPPAAAPPAAPAAPPNSAAAMGVPAGQQGPIDAVMNPPAPAGPGPQLGPQFDLPSSAARAASWQKSKQNIYLAAAKLGTPQDFLTMVDAVNKQEKKRTVDLLQGAVAKSIAGDMYGAAMDIEASGLLGGDGSTITRATPYQNAFVLQDYDRDTGTLKNTYALTPEQIQDMALAYADMPAYVAARQNESKQRWDMQVDQAKMALNVAESVLRQQDTALDIAIKQAAILETGSAGRSKVGGKDAKTLQENEDAAVKLFSDRTEAAHRALMDSVVDPSEVQGLKYAPNGVLTPEAIQLVRGFTSAFMRADPSMSPDDAATTTAWLLQQPDAHFEFGTFTAPLSNGEMYTGPGVMLHGSTNMIRFIDGKSYADIKKITLDQRAADVERTIQTAAADAYRQREGKDPSPAQLEDYIQKNGYRELAAIRDDDGNVIGYTTVTSVWEDKIAAAKAAKKAKQQQAQTQYAQMTTAAPPPQAPAGMGIRAEPQVMQADQALNLLKRTDPTQLAQMQQSGQIGAVDMTEFANAYEAARLYYGNEHPVVKAWANALQSSGGM